MKIPPTAADHPGLYSHPPTPLIRRTLPALLRPAWRRVLILWRPMALWTLLVWGAGVVLLTPLTSWVVGRGWFRGPDGLVGNEQILAWVFTLPGVLLIVVAGALALTGAVLHYSGLHLIVTDDLEGHPTGVLRTALRLLPKIPVLVRLAAFTVAGAVLLALPLVAGLAGVYALLLSAHDINYYLAERPPEWHRALLLSCFVLALSALVEGLAGILPSLRLLALTAAAATGLAVALDAVLGFLGFAVLPTVLAKFYHVDSGLHLDAPNPPRLSDIPRALRRRVHPFLRPGRLVPGMAFLLAGSLAAGGMLLERVAEPVPAEVHAHRTGPPPSPENTLAALERSIAAGADFAEIDAQRTRDGVLVVVHDADLMRVAGDPRRITATDYAELAGVVQRPDDGTTPSEREVATLTVGDPTTAEVDFLAVPTSQLTPALLRRARAREMRVLVWTVNDRRTMVELVRRGVDGIITDDPALAVEVNRELAGMPVAGLILLGVGRR